MSQFKNYRRKNVSEMRQVTKEDIAIFKEHEVLHIKEQPYGNNVSISDADLKNGSPKNGDMIARNPMNHNDQWLVAEKYFNDNLELI